MKCPQSLLLGLVFVLTTGSGPALAGALDTARIHAQQWQAALHGPAYQRLLAAKAGPRQPGDSLVGIRPDGRPVYVGYDNEPAAATVGIDAIWPGGRTGYALTGLVGANDLAIWDGGCVLDTHRELAGRISLGDDFWYDDHATAVAGVLLATGIVPWARGMAYEGRVTSYDWYGDNVEMADAAAELRLSNHSYGFICGWKQSESGWTWYGDVRFSRVEDVDFGRYSQVVSIWDEIAAAAPRYLICKSAGNDHDNAGPPPGTPHRVFDHDLHSWVDSYEKRPPDGRPDGFDCIPVQANAKNILSVGAVLIAYDGYTGPESVELTWYSSRGPTDDGRIKPDLVAPGDGLITCTAASDTALSGFGGTSAAAPVACGALTLLLEHQRRLLPGPDLLACTRKGLLLHTTREAGAHPGPDFAHGWGLLDAEAAALLLAEAADAPGRIGEGELATGEADTFHYWHPAPGDLRVTLCWTDPAGPVREVQLDRPDPVLVNDLDLRLVRVIDGVAHEPWLLDPRQPRLPAVAGPNHRDNVEQVFAADAARGNWLVIVSHTGELTAVQAYGLIQTGLASRAGLEPHEPPAAVSLVSMGPNPSRGTTRIALAAERPVDVRLLVFDLRGRLIRVLADDRHAPGQWSETWDGHDQDGEPVPSGIYLLRLESPEAVTTRRLTLVR